MLNCYTQLARTVALPWNGYDWNEFITFHTASIQKYSKLIKFQMNNFPRKKKKMMIIHHSGLLGGAGLSLESMLPILDKHFDLQIFVPKSPEFIYERLRSLKYKVYAFNGRLGKITTYSGGNKFLGLRFIFHAIKIPIHYLRWLWLIRKFNPDALLVNSRVLCWFSLIPFSGVSICFVRETIDSDSMYCERAIVTPLLRKFDVRLFLSKFDRDSHGFNDDASLISPDFIEISRFTVHPRDFSRKFLNLENSKFVISYVGGVDPLKGLSLLLKSINHLQEICPNIVDSLSIIICGDVSIKTLYKYKDLYADDDFNLVKCFIEGSNESIFLKLGLQDDLSMVYSASNCLVFPMTKPHQSRPAFEIGLFGGFPILPNFDNVSEYFRDNDNAVIYKNNCYKDLAAKIEKLVLNPEWGGGIGQRNRRETETNRNPSNCMRSLIDYVSRV